MITNKMKTLALVLGLSTSALMNYSFAAEKKGGDSGGGGDALEERVNEIRSDLSKWIKAGGSKGLKFTNGFTLEEYNDEMLQILKSKRVIVGFVENDDSKDEELRVVVNGIPKTCRGFISKKDNNEHILCSIPRFNKTSESEQYKLIHHEYAGLVRVEQNEGAASDYEISTQITQYLAQEMVLRLAIKKPVVLACNNDKDFVATSADKCPSSIEVGDSYVVNLTSDNVNSTTYKKNDFVNAKVFNIKDQKRVYVKLDNEEIVKAYSHSLYITSKEIRFKNATGVEFKVGDRLLINDTAVKILGFEATRQGSLLAYGITQIFNVGRAVWVEDEKSGAYSIMDLKTLVKGN